MAYLWSYFLHFERKIWTKMSETGKKSPREIVIGCLCFSAKTDRN